MFKIRGCGTMALRKFLSPLPAQLVAPSEPQTLAVSLRRIVAGPRLARIIHQPARDSVRFPNYRRENRTLSRGG
ncbi:hypothetical protein Pla52n_51220 [Stieleria varia]|uniref:Uncharacterized protein n=1 Tax=Stieleria varia TaxID=2528005 RepID=A0A5C6AHF4_9BACT|nr:hypothetical protein Pla52n_51220 [Stieleria varia]